MLFHHLPDFFFWISYYSDVMCVPKYLSKWLPEIFDPEYDNIQEILAVEDTFRLLNTSSNHEVSKANSQSK